MATWRTEEDFITDMCELNEIGEDEEVNEKYWMLDSSSNEEPPVAKQPSSVIPIETPKISNAAMQKKITFDIISDMSKANITFEPDYKELMKQKVLASKDVSKEPQGFKKPKKWKPMSESQGPSGTSGSNQFNWQPFDPTPFSVKKEEFPTLGKK